MQYGRGDKPMHNPQTALKREEKNKLFKKGEAEQGTVAESIASEVKLCVLVCVCVRARARACVNGCVRAWCVCVCKN
jgi:hypothetical protein